MEGAPEFQAWPKTPRLFRDMVITEKIDGTNSAVIVTEDGRAHAQSRSRIITPGKSADNFGFAAWVAENEDSLVQLLGPGYHYGEWWGKGIQRGYGMTYRRFSLFNVARYEGYAELTDGLLFTVPVLYRGPFSTPAVENVRDQLALSGSWAAPGFMKPEGVVVFHEAARSVFKSLLENDEAPKGKI